MKFYLIFLCFSLLFFSCESNTTVNNSEVEGNEKEIEFIPKYTFNNYSQKISYCIGLDHGTSTKMQFESSSLINKFRISEVEKGMNDYLSGAELKVLPQQIDSIFELYLTDNDGVDSSKVSASMASYAFGVTEGKILVASLVARQIDQNVIVDLLLLGLEDGIKGNTPSVPLKEARIEVLTHYSDINRNRGENFLVLNAQRKEVTTTISGLQYEVFTKGKGNQPIITDSVLVHYTSRFIDGRVFDSSKPSNTPISFTLHQVIPAWTEVLQLMTEGSEYRIFVPYQLAYGEEGFKSVEPYTTLVFDLELILIH